MAIEVTTRPTLSSTIRIIILFVGNSRTNKHTNLLLRLVENEGLKKTEYRDPYTIRVRIEVSFPKRPLGERNKESTEDKYSKGAKETRYCAIHTNRVVRTQVPFLRKIP
jgi:hypothetical protein